MHIIIIIIIVKVEALPPPSPWIHHRVTPSIWSGDYPNGSLISIYIPRGWLMVNMRLRKMVRLNFFSLQRLRPFVCLVSGMLLRKP